MYKSILCRDPREGRNHNWWEWRKGGLRLELQSEGAGAAHLRVLDLPL